MSAQCTDKRAQMHPNVHAGARTFEHLHQVRKHCDFARICHDFVKGHLVRVSDVGDTTHSKTFVVHDGQRVGHLFQDDDRRENRFGLVEHRTNFIGLQESASRQKSKVNVRVSEQGSMDG